MSGLSGVSKLSGLSRSPRVQSQKVPLSGAGESGTSPMTKPCSPSRSAGPRRCARSCGHRPAQSMTVLTKVIRGVTEVCAAWNGVEVRGAAWVVVVRGEGWSVVG